MRRAARVDANQAEIVAALRAVGASVQDLHCVGEGVPDLVVGFRGQNYLIEVKGLTELLNGREARWHDAWRGQVAMVWDVDSALQAIGVMEVERVV